MNVYDGEGDMDDDAREQIIERLLFAWQNAELAAATSNAHRHELLQTRTAQAHSDGLTISVAEARALLHGMPDYDFSAALTRLANWLAEYDETPTPPGSQIRTAKCDGEDAVPVTGSCR